MIFKLFINYFHFLLEKCTDVNEKHVTEHVMDVDDCKMATDLPSGVTKISKKEISKWTLSRSQKNKLRKLRKYKKKNNRRK